MVTTDKLNCNILADLLANHGVCDIIASPGSRNAPLLTAFSVRSEYRLRMVIDERSAAFIALGLALESGRPVALVCTSGTALLNYAPAVAEAYYRNAPLIIVSADRPEEWIDQDDSQTIRQPGCLESIVKASYDIPARLPADDDRWRANREINDAITLALSPRRGPVHINIRIDSPLGRLAEYEPNQERIVHSTATAPAVSDRVIRQLAEEISTCQRVMIVAGFMSTDHALNSALDSLGRQPNIIVLSETVSNIKGDNIIPAIDLTLSGMTTEELNKLKPELVITLGGALVSRKIKEYLRGASGMKHWHIGTSAHLIDCFRKLTLAVAAEPVDFFPTLVAEIKDKNIICSDYRNHWMECYRKSRLSHDVYTESIGWSDMKAFEIILGRLKSHVKLHFSNGTPVRYSQLFGYLPFRRTDCNRGVSGIDGCTSTAIGASLATDESVILLTGDMSFQYDVAALASRLITPRLKIIVIMNSGGGIFRFVESTAAMPKREFFFSESMNLPIRQLAEAYGFSFFAADNEISLRKSLDEFLSETGHPAILAVTTPPEESAEILKNYFCRI